MARTPKSSPRPRRSAAAAAAAEPTPKGKGKGKAGKLTVTATAAKAVAAEQGLPTGRPIRVYADGIYDLFHYGHMRQLEQCKKLFPNVHLLVGVVNDELTHKYKGRTVMTEEERYETVAHCKWVDEVVKDAPWCVDAAFLKDHEIDFVAHDDLPYPDTSGSGEDGDAYSWVKKIGKFRATKRTNGISTSDLILRLVKDYNEYVMRNLQRGYTRRDMNVSLLREKRLRLRGKLRQIETKVREQRLFAKVSQFVDAARDLHTYADSYVERFWSAVRNTVRGRGRATRAS